jgi:PAS domain S-box-containing protein
MKKAQGKQKEASSSVSLLPQIGFSLGTEVKEKRLHILHVDDDASFLEVSKEILSLENNFEIDTAESAEEAYRKMSYTSYDAIVSDYQMPKKNGLDFLMELRAQKVEIPFILLTGKGREEIAIKALNLGADGYVNKQGKTETVYGELTHYVRQAIEKKQAKTAFSNSQGQLEAIIMNAPIGISASCSTDKIFENANPAFCKILGYDKDELRKLTFREITYPEDLSESISKVEDLKAGKIPAFTLEKRYVRKDGSIIYGKVNVNTVRDKDGKICLFIVELEDITESKRAEQDLKESEEKYKTLFEQAEQADSYLLVLEVPATGFPTIYDANASALQAHGYTREEIIGKPITFLDENSKPILSRVNKLLNGEKLNFTAKHRRKDGSVFYAEVTLKKVKIGSKIFFVSIERDITERKKMEDAIRQDREMLEALTENLGVGFGIISKDYRVLWVNRFIKNNVGDVEGRQCYSSLNTLDHICPDCGVRKVFEEGVERDSHEYSQIGINGKPYYVELIATPLKDKDGNVTAALEFVVDIAEKKQREKDLRESREEFKALFNSNPQAAVYSDENFCIININPKFTEVFGYALDEIRGKNQIDVLVPEELKQEMNNNIEKSWTRAVSFQTKRKRKDGSTLQVFISLAPVLAGGKRIGTVTVFTDMTEQVAAEEKIEAALNQSEILNEKLSVVGSFTRHDVRNKLMTIEGNAYLAKKQAGNDPKMIQYLDQIRLAITNITRILEFAKNYESLGSEERTQMDVGGAIDQAASLFSGLKGAELTNECRGFNILADSMLTTVFHNLIDNSLKYGENLTKIRIYHSREKDGSESIIYEDNGGGINEEDKTHLFKKGFGKGTGVGLYLIKRTCDIYGWKVKETGDFGKGVKFEFNIPAKR